MNGQHDTGSQRHRTVLFAFQFQVAFLDQRKNQQGSRGPHHPAAGNDHRGGVHELPQNGGKPEQHHRKMEQQNAAALGAGVHDKDLHGRSSSSVSRRLYQPISNSAAAMP